jgi:hypothetical protein
MFHTREVPPGCGRAKSAFKAFTKNAYLRWALLISAKGMKYGKTDPDPADQR